MNSNIAYLHRTGKFGMLNCVEQQVRLETRRHSVDSRSIIPTSGRRPMVGLASPPSALGRRRPASAVTPWERRSGEEHNHWTQIHLSAHNGHLEVVKSLLEHSADAHVLYDDGRTPYQLSLRKGYRKIADFFGTKFGTTNQAGRALQNVRQSHLILWL
jgi:hypothetical protein